MCDDIPVLDDARLAQPEDIRHGIWLRTRRWRQPGMQNDELAFGDGSNGLGGVMQIVFGFAAHALDVIVHEPKFTLTGGPRCHPPERSRIPARPVERRVSRTLGCPVNH